MNNQYIPADYVVVANKITDEVAVKLSKKYNMKLMGSTGGMADCVNVIGLSFQIRGPLSQEILRKILVGCVEEFLVSINANEQLRPFLKNYPFTPHEIEIEIFVVDDTGKKIYDPEIGVATAKHGGLRYHTKAREPGYLFGYKTTTREDYNAALKIVKGSQP
ncbi:MAG: hypothetical protein WCF65_07090 [Parachlamydiaceae bacterium]